MPSSYERINFTLRPAKSIERKMLAEAFRRLSPFGAVESYRYIGFGSVFFSDFSLFHRSLGITNMLSIEKDEWNRERFEFNRPFRCIRIEFGHSNSVLPRLSWDERTIIWLDYDAKLDASVLADIAWVCVKAIAGSVLVITVNSQADEKGWLNKLKRRVGEENVPADVRDQDLKGWGLALVSRRIITNKIYEVLTDRNGVTATEGHIAYRQLFNFRYGDNARMLTVGGLILENGQLSAFQTCDLNDLQFIRPDDRTFEIRVPPLTVKEMRHLDGKLPCDDPEGLDAAPISGDALRAYSEVYRYFPAFVEAEL